MRWVVFMQCRNNRENFYEPRSPPVGAFVRHYACSIYTPSFGQAGAFILSHVLERLGIQYSLSGCLGPWERNSRWVFYLSCIRRYAVKMAKYQLLMHDREFRAGNG